MFNTLCEDLFSSLFSEKPWVGFYNINVEKWKYDEIRILTFHGLLILGCFRLLVSSKITSEKYFILTNVKICSISFSRLLNLYIFICIWSNNKQCFELIKYHPVLCSINFLVDGLKKREWSEESWECSSAKRFMI